MKLKLEKDIEDLIRKYEIQRKTLTEVINTGSSDPDRALACRRFVSSIIDDLNHLVSFSCEFCDNGLDAGGEMCKACKGTGKR